MVKQHQLHPILNITNDQIITEIKVCRICGSDKLKPVVNLGAQYLSGLFGYSDPPDFMRKKYPLELVRCSDKDGCGLVQLKHSVSPVVLYYDYGYRSGINEMMRNNLREIAHKAETIVPLSSGDTVLDIGCNDGTLLCAYSTHYIDRLGIDPAQNVVEVARKQGLEVISDFFSAQVYEKARPGKKAKIITSIAMFYDLEEPLSFVRDVASILADDGVWVIELSYLPFMLQKNSFDTICHEHLEYYALRQIEWMLRQVNLAIYQIEFNDVNGGSFRMFIRKTSAGAMSEDTRAQLEAIRKTEDDLKLTSDGPYDSFRKASLKVKKDLSALLTNLASEGKSIYVYGASTKGNVILQYCGIDNTIITKAADRNPEKWGRYTLGTNIPIISEEQARAEKPDYFLVLPWHFFEVFKERERAFLERGGKFILPLPEVKVIGREDL